MPANRNEPKANGYIYRLYSDTDDHYYYGCTTTSLHKRKSDHKRSSRFKTYPVYQWANTIGWEFIKIQEIAVFENISTRDLEQKESDYITQSKQDSNCLNCIRSYITDEERRQRDKNQKHNNWLLHADKWSKKLKERRANLSPEEYELLLESERANRARNKATSLRCNKDYYHRHKETISRALSAIK